MPVSTPTSRSDLLTLISAAMTSAYGDDSMLCYGTDPEAEDLRSSQTHLLTLLLEEVNVHSKQATNVFLSGHSLQVLQKQLHEAGRNVLLGDSETDPLPIDHFQLAVIEGSILYLDQLALFTQLRRIMQDEGKIILFGENLNDDSRIERSELANLSSLRQLSERLGFELLDEQDFTAGAAHSLGLLQGQLQSDAERLMNILNWESERFDKVVAELNVIRAEFASGRRCFRLFEFKKLADPPGEYTEAVYGDIDSFEPAEVAQLFEASFGVDFDAELWQWKYQLGQGTCVAVREREGGDIVSHYGGAPRKIDYFGESSMAIQPCDVMVLPEVRRHYGKSSLFFKTAATFLEREIGNTVRQLLGFGFPNQKAMNIALRLGLYEKTDDFVEINYAQAQPVQHDYQFLALNLEDPQHQQAIDKLWQQMRGGYTEGIIGVRDAAYIDYRYIQHPFAKRGQLNTQLIMDATGEVAALVALKEHDQQQLLMDIVCEKERMQSLLPVVAAYCAEHANMAMKMWITAGWVEQVKLEGCTVNGLGIEIPCNSWNPGPSSQVLYGNWWLTAGDMDFV